MKKPENSKNRGFSLIELLVAMTILLLLLGMAATLFAAALSTRARESRRTDALTSARAAIMVISREVSNSGYGMGTNELKNNGIVLADSNQNRIHFRANIDNSNITTDSPGEDVTYFFDADTNSIVRYDPNESVETSVVVNRISNVTFTYFNYSGSSSLPTETATPTTNTGRVRINVTVQLEPVQGQPDNQTVSFTSDVTLRNSNYMLNQY